MEKTAGQILVQFSSHSRHVLPCHVSDGNFQENLGSTMTGIILPSGAEVHGFFLFGLSPWHIFQQLIIIRSTLDL